jgi:two-component sensor histidine kinase
MLHTGQPLVIPDTTASPSWVPLKGWHDIRSYLSAPIQVAGQTVGFLNVDGLQPAQFGHADAQRLQAFAQHAATALQNAQLYERAQLEIAERRRAELQIQASLDENEVLLKEIHHRVKNNLQVISSLLYLQSRHAQDPLTLSMFLESQHRVRSMALVHETLCRTEDLARVDLAQYVRNLSSYLLQSYSPPPNPIQLSIQVDDVSLDMDAAVPCGLILNELVSNCLKHAFPGGRQGEIIIQLRQTDQGQHILAVSDNGLGLPDGFDIRTTPSLGLQLVNRLVNQLGGTIELSRHPGTRIQITFAESQNDKGEGQ